VTSKRLNSTTLEQELKQMQLERQRLLADNGSLMLHRMEELEQLRQCQARIAELESRLAAYE
jgi:hypothetical protein